MPAPFLSDIDEKSRALQQQELGFLRDLAHKNIVQAYTSFFVDLKTYVLVMEDMGDQDLEAYVRHELLSEYRLIPEYRIWRYLTQIADALTFVHSKNVLHRDLKTSNILKSGSLIKVGDFGLSKRVKPGGKYTERCGTPFYLAPERMGKKAYGFPSDVWSLGCIFYEMCTGVSPYFGERSNEYSLRTKIVHSDCPPISEDCYSFFVEDLIASMLQKDPAYRPDAAFVAAYARKIDNYYRTKFPDLPDI
uniref:non-specific serine/threonine protein kinase n=1 Tax=Bursaphelenchus xylophilus TaxID=6326 RepID=A0A1I7RI22_BURXY